MDMQGKTVVITGASRGIGADAARVFAAAGANLALLARSTDALGELVGELGGNALAFACDVAEPSAVAAALEKAHEHFGSLDVLINNAGVIEPIARLEEADPAAWGKLIDINIKGVFNGIRAALPLMKPAGGGTIITVSSGAAHNPLEAWSAYCTSKAGAAMLTRALHLEEGGNGIRAMGLSPGTVATQMQREIKASGINPVSELDWEDHIPAEWPAKALLWMCGSDADDFLGQEISLREDAIRRRVGLI
ncbi:MULTISPECIES: SDR family oxidoreductase [Rhodobacterales]|jgi:NAD(P)-dependent dehydrogenase (short-subunit alcohol dehydrogenase family)|uniref:Short-chain dehydrogenase n=1 Tax=Phaeobacter gallaeciensis TaxID=60890 RepID=A0A1B0ZS58_9RHOB|nr:MULTISPECIES: SDR family oxidoreductase [Phaeobacter]ANP36986.1 short-chain dehydrogenase [Phaeobacter gallaeciensis]MDE4097943.1 SDR family oxidoreductase [Phaeobacter gallaeciensis]MDE4106798.1 SDR family oxidoreductase [Phaeobacter gallaeciensis]MDE4111252.1 SDR family oxidoreductase [Phaeobacter gallaeciensis]MDE4115678.1 SDR family oxidoreductase [Phaeobacter gallaeciensis]